MLLLTLAPGLSPLLAQEAKTEQQAKKEREKQVRITEEILVVGKSPKDVPLATVSTVLSSEINALKPRDLSDILKFIPGSMVTFGDKDTYTLKLR
ncbi:MAG: TonB-dependent receptor domain-containing protein, partial [Candidatus Aminicenantales bacterium]